MKNNILIDELKKYNPDAEVVLTSSEDIFISYIDNNGEFNKMNTPIIFIEGCDLL